MNCSPPVSTRLSFPPYPPPPPEPREDLRSRHFGISCSFQRNGSTALLLPIKIRITKVVTVHVSIGPFHYSMMSRQTSVAETA